MVYPIIIGIYNGDDTRRKGNGKKEQQSAKGRQVITLNLAIILRVTLVRDFVKSLFTLYKYILSLKGYFYTKQAIGCLSNTIIFI